MRRGFFCVLPLLVCFFSFGCGNASHPGIWNQTEIEAYMLKTENPKMSEVKLSSNSEGGFSGTGKAADGETFQLSIKQNAALKKISWSAKGDRGTVIDDASYEFVK